MLPFHNRDFLIGQAVELVDHLINKRVGPLNVSEQGREFGETGGKLALQRFLELSWRLRSSVGLVKLIRLAFTK